MFSQTNEKLRRDLDDSEQTRARLELAVSQLRSSNRDLTGKLKVEKDEVDENGSCFFHTFCSQCVQCPANDLCPCLLFSVHKIQQGSQQQEVKFQDQIFRKFQDNFRTLLCFVGFTRLKTQKIHVFLCS